VIYPFLLLFTTLVALILLYLYIKNRRKEMLLLVKLQNLTTGSGRSAVEMIELLEKEVFSLKERNCTDSKSFTELSDRILSQTISVKEGFNGILKGAAEVGKMTEEKMSCVEEAAESSRNIVSAVSNITANMEVQVSSFRETIPHLQNFIESTSHIGSRTEESRSRSNELVEKLHNADRS